MEYNPKYSSKLTPVLNIVEILILFLSGAAIIMGMVGVDLFTRVVIGPIALFCIGLTIQVAIVDTKFPISRKLDIWVKDWIRIDHSDSEKISSRIVFISFLAFFGLFLLTAVLSLGIASYTFQLFAVNLSLASIFLGLLISRTAVKLFSSNNRTQISEIENYSHELRLENYRDFIRNLSADSDELEISKAQAKLVSEQRKILIAYAKDNSLISKLDNNSTNLEHKSLTRNLLSHLSTSYTNWIMGVKNQLILDNHPNSTKQRLESLLIMPVLLDMIRQSITDEKVSNEFVRALFDGFADCLAQLNHSEYELHSAIAVDALYPISQSIDEIKFIRELSRSVEIVEVSDWDPWWLLNLRPKIGLLRDENRAIKPVNLNNDSENLFNALAISVKKLYHAGRVKSVENDRFKIVKESFNLFELGNYEEHHYDLTNIQNNCPKLESLYLEILSWSWCLFISTRDLSEPNAKSKSKPVTFAEVEKQMISQTPTYETYRSLTKIQLIEMLKSRGLKRSGNKKELINRLLQSQE